MRAFLSILITVFLAAGCGYKGPLYLPKDKPEAKRPAAAPVQKKEEAKKEEEKQ